MCPLFVQKVAFFALCNSAKKAADVPLSMYTCYGPTINGRSLRSPERRQPILLWAISRFFTAFSKRALMLLFTVSSSKPVVISVLEISTKTSQTTDYTFFFPQHGGVTNLSVVSPRCRRWHVRAPAYSGETFPSEQSALFHSASNQRPQSAQGEKGRF